MTERCAICSYEPLLSRFCPECGTERATARPRGAVSGDPFVGRVVAERYEVGELISVGGMGRVHRGVQRSLDRAIAIKFVHPHLLTSVDAVTRFMTEARAASRLNHPNVVSIFDFGRTAPSEGNDLFIVMELLCGSDIAALVAREGLLSIPRVVDIVRQTLLALAEAHSAGITHRDVKPENVFVTGHGDSDHVKVIDFGLASIHAGRRITQEGHAMGTPAFMAPEQVRGQSVGPAADQYAAGVMLFELLTGSLPFDDASPLEVMHQHVLAPRPDPRHFAPERSIPETLAAVCMRAMAVDPAKRFANARELCRALVASYRSTPPLAISRDLVVARPGEASADRLETLPVDDERSHVSRDDVWRTGDLARIADELVADDTRHGVIVTGRAGVGCSYLATAAAETIGAHVMLRVRIDEAPRCTVRGAGLRRILRAVFARLGDRDLAAESQRTQGPVARGLRALLRDAEPLPTAADSAEVLSWALGRVVRETGARAVLLVDDVDRMDPFSMRAFRLFTKSAPSASLRIVLTCEHVPSGLDSRFATFVVRGVSRDLAESRLTVSAPDVLLVRRDDDIEPLYLQQLARWTRRSDESAPATLGDLLEARIQSLGATERRALQSIALTGGGTAADAAAAFPDAKNFTRAIETLEAEGFVTRTGGEIRVAHSLVARVVLSVTPGGALEALHAAVADRAEDRGAPVELRLHHALRGRGDLAAFLLAERVIAQRIAEGDTESAIVLLADALHVARLRLAHGESEAAESAATVFARKLAEVLIRQGRSDEAHGVATEALAACDPSSPARGPLLELAKSIARQRGRGARRESPADGLPSSSARSHATDRAREA